MSIRQELYAAIETLSTPVSLLFALFLTVVAVAVRWLLDPWLGDDLPLVTLYGAVAAAAWLGGRIPGLLAAVSGYLLCDYLFIEPQGIFGFFATDAFVGALAYLLTCVIVIAMGDARRRAQDQSHRRNELLQTTRQTLERSERDLADFFDNAPVALHWIGPDGVISRANQAQLDLLGYSRDEFVGQHISKFYVDRDVIDDTLARLLRGDSRAKHSARMRCSDGSIKKVVVDSNSLWDDGRFVHSRCIMFDVTSQKREEETRALLAAIVAASDDAIVSKTLEGIILTWNEGAQRLFGYSPSEAVGRSIDLIIPLELRHEERHILQRISQGDRIDHFETIRVTKDGRLLDISLTVSPVRDESGRVIGASKVARDITERKRVDAALRDADRRKDEFLATLAHELRNPLAPIRHSLEILLRSRGDQRLFRHATDILERQLSHMIRLVDDLLDVSRITRDKLQLRKTRVDLTSIVRHAVEVSRPTAERDQQTIEVSLPDRPIYLDADPVRLTQVVSNLLNNACQYTEPGGRIWLSAQREGNQVVIAVRDSGIGMPADQLDGIFEMFAQVQADPASAARPRNRSDARATARPTAWRDGHRAERGPRVGQ